MKKNTYEEMFLILNQFVGKEFNENEILKALGSKDDFIIEAEDYGYRVIAKDADYLDLVDLAVTRMADDKLIVINVF